MVIPAVMAVAVAISFSSNRRLVDVDAMRAVTALNLGAYLAERGEKGLAPSVSRVDL